MSANSKVIEQVFDTWLKHEFPLIRPEGKHLGELRIAFYTGAWVALGLIFKTHNMPEHTSVIFLNDIQLEIWAVINTHVSGVIKNGKLRS